MASSPRRIRIVAGNWKMNHGPSAALSFLEKFAKELSASPVSGVDSRLYVPAVTLAACLSGARKHGLDLQIGAQNGHWEKQGAFTGELSAPLLKEIGVTHCLVGHSERRQFFGETDESCRKRVHGLLDQDVHVLFCIGETRAEREAAQTERVLTRQLEAVLGKSAQMGSSTRDRLKAQFAIAYEPVWAIGTGLTATPEQAQEAHAFVRSWLRTHLGAEAAQETRILYGGSVTVDNFAALLNGPDVDGGLVGGASLKPDGFARLVSLAG